MLNVITVIITNYDEYIYRYLKQSIDSSIGPFLVYDGLEPVDKTLYHVECNFKNNAKCKNLAISEIKKIKNSEFIQFLNPDSYLSENYYKELEKHISENNEFDFFYTDYEIHNEDFDYQYREYLLSPSSSYIRETAPKIKNPLIRLSAFKNKRFDENLTCYEMVDMIYQIGIKKMYHIPQSLQCVRIHPKCHERMTPTKSKLESMEIINRRLHGKV